MAQLTRQVRLPEDWQVPVLLSFFATDNRHGEGYDPAEWPHCVGAGLLVGHRYPQVLIDGQVIWERDVADSDSPGWRPGRSQDTADRDCYYPADTTEHVQPGQYHQSALRILDKAGSRIALPRDVHQGHRCEPADLHRMQANKWFGFTAWWGDVFLSSRQSAPATQKTFYSRIRLQHVLPVSPLPRSRRVEIGAKVKLAIARAGTLSRFHIHSGAECPSRAAWSATTRRSEMNERRDCWALLPRPRSAKRATVTAGLGIPLLLHSPSGAA